MGAFFSLLFKQTESENIVISPDVYEYRVIEDDGVYVDLENNKRPNESKTSTYFNEEPVV